MFVTLLVAGAVFCGSTIPAQACSCRECRESQSACVKEAFRDSAAVFIGVPVEVSVDRREIRDSGIVIPTTTYHIRFMVKETFKGITTSYPKGDLSPEGICSYGYMEKDRTYLIYADFISGDSVVSISLCSRTSPLDSGAPYSWSESEKKSVAKSAKLLRKEIGLLRRLRTQNVMRDASK